LLIANRDFGQQSISVSLSVVGNTALAGGYGDNGFTGVAWVYATRRPASTTAGVQFLDSAWRLQS
jgi:hypothetical protein